MAKVMIESAVNGNALRTTNPHVPYSPKEIADDAIASCRAGASIIHFHVRDAKSGAWTQDVPSYREVILRTREHCNPILWPTFPHETGDPMGRVAHFVELAKDPATRPDMGVCDPGSLNFCTIDPETNRVLSTTLYRNIHENNVAILETYRRLGLRPTIQVFDASFLRVALLLLRQGLLSEPLVLKFYLGGPQKAMGLPPTRKSLEAYLQMLEGVRCHWFAAVLGGDVLPLLPDVLALGGHVRVGFEDYLYAREGQLTNAQIVDKTARSIRELGHEVATPAEARSLLELS